MLPTTQESRCQLHSQWNTTSTVFVCLFVCLFVFFLKKKIVKKCFQVTWRQASNSLVWNACCHCDIARQDSSMCVHDETMRETMCKLCRDIAPVGGHSRSWHSQRGQGIPNSSCGQMPHCHISDSHPRLLPWLETYPPWTVHFFFLVSGLTPAAVCCTIPLYSVHSVNNNLYMSAGLQIPLLQLGPQQRALRANASCHTGTDWSWTAFYLPTIPPGQTGNTVQQGPVPHPCLWMAGCLRPHAALVSPGVVFDHQWTSLKG